MSDPEKITSIRCQTTWYRSAANPDAKNSRYGSAAAQAGGRQARAALMASLLGDKTFEFNELSHLRKPGIGERFSSCLRAGPILLAFSGANQESDNV